MTDLERLEQFIERGAEALPYGGPEDRYDQARRILVRSGLIGRLRRAEEVVDACRRYFQPSSSPAGTDNIYAALDAYDREEE